ncbi:hypothetical protein [Burkholderia sp. MSMB1459WGS]|uniref:hypothetical protein n=1 Tax=Burkholderia sp. MSMB1459WGS TaxID=1637970 RepID=UPI00211D8801|nr:hypothetical protein [Burkholderia sp. MSMB1459WGS]
MVFISGKGRMKRGTAFLNDLHDRGKMCHFLEIVAFVTGLSSNAVILRLPRDTQPERGSEAGRQAACPETTGEPDRARPFGVPPTEK